MKMNTNEVVADKCRLCLVNGDKNDLTPLFTVTEDPELSLAARIMVCLSIPVRARDSLPCSICKICENRVTQFYAFREICYDSYYSLLRHRVAVEADDFVEDAEEGDKSQTKLQTFDESSISTEQNMCLSVQLGTDNETVEDDIPQETHLEESIVLEVPVENVQSNTSVAELLNSDAEIENEKCKLNFQDEKPREEENNRSEDANSEKEVQDIKYKCMRCDRLFLDFDSASIHCAECLPDEDEVNVTTDPAETLEYLDEELKESIEDETTAEVQSESLNCPADESDPTSQRISVLSYAYSDDKSTAETTKSSHVGRRKSEKKSRHSCAECESAFSSAALLRRHSVVHTGERPFECPICKKRFSQVGQLNFHKNFHENPRYRCEVCRKPFLRPSDIEKHMRTHTGEKPYGCVVCSKSFAQLVALQQHERIHTGDKPYVCEICGKKFSQKANKTKHVKIHKEGAKPHTCEICGRSFSDLEEMNLHRAGHGGGKPRKCNYCEESFRKTSELTQHVRRYHTFERPHKCGFCLKAFYSLYNLKQHVMVHTGQKPYACSLCDLKFTQKGNLTKHVERKHGEKYSVVAESEEELVENDCMEILQRHRDPHENYTLDRDKYIATNGDHSYEGNEQEMLILTNEITENTTESVIIEREETVQVDVGEDHTDLQIYDINQ